MFKLILIVQKIEYYKKRMFTLERFDSPSYNQERLISDLNGDDYYNNFFNENEFNESSFSKFIIREGLTNYKTDLANCGNEKQFSKVDICTWETIKEILKKNLISILDFYEYDSDIEKPEMRYINKKRRNRENYNSITNIEGFKISKLGRKKKSDCSQRYHNKHSPDNIIKKIKSKLFENILQFMNNILNSIKINEKKKILKDIDYKYINRLKKDFDLDLLNKSIKDLLSLDVSPKFNVDSDFNKKTIKLLIEENNDNYFLKFALNMKFREWLELFTLKTDIKEFSNNFSNELLNNMPKVDDMLKGIIDKNADKNYICSFTFYLYNYENWFLMKRPKK